MVLELKRKQFDVTQYHQMIATGLLCEGDRLELIEGEILEIAQGYFKLMREHIKERKPLDPTGDAASPGPSYKAASRWDSRCLPRPIVGFVVA